MTDTALLTGQDIGEAEGAMTALLERALAPSGRSRTEYITLRVLAARGPFRTSAELTDFLTGQRQLGLNHADAQRMLDSLRSEGLVTPEPLELTARGRAALTELASVIAPITRQIFADLDTADLSVAHRVLLHLTRRANEMTSVAAAD